MIATAQQFQSELGHIEIKTAQRGTPQRLHESLSAFANRNGGGVILLGLDENRSFEIVGVGDPQNIVADISQLAADAMEPPSIPIHLAEVAGKTVLAVEVFEIATEQKPCFYKPAGLQSGSFIRVGNSNRQMSGYEVFSYLSNRGQPAFDEEAVSEATLATSTGIAWMTSSLVRKPDPGLRPRAWQHRQRRVSRAAWRKSRDSLTTAQRTLQAGLFRREGERRWARYRLS